MADPSVVSASPIPTHDITGVLLAGGRGSRMGGIDKGQQTLNGLSLAAHAMARLTPQVGPMLISANRELAAYQALASAWQATVIVDTLPDFPGPLAGILAALEASTTPYLACVPCDTPYFPGDLIVRLAQAFDDPRREIASVCAPDEMRDINHNAALVKPRAMRSHPVFALMRCDAVRDGLRASLLAGERRVNAWRMRHNAVEVTFDDEQAFYNINTLQALAACHNARA